VCPGTGTIKGNPIRENTKFYPNTSLYVFGEKLRYTEFYYQNTKRIHQISAVENSGYLQKVLKKTKKGAKIDKLAESITNDGINSGEANEFIHELIDNQILVPEFEPSVTGMGFLENILAFLKNTEQTGKYYPALIDVYHKIKEIDQQKPGIDTNKYIKIAESLKDISTSYELKYLFQADMIKPADKLTLSKEIVEQVKEGIEVLNLLTVLPNKNNLTRFRDAFSKKYGDKEIPLLQALDTESGIGFGENHNPSNGDYAPLIEEIILPKAKFKSSSIEWNHVHSFLFQKYLEAIKENRYQVELDEKEIIKLADNERTNLAPVTISTMVQIINLDGSEKVIMESAGGAGAGNLLGRFCHTDDEINSHVSEIVKKEQAFYADKIIAEIVHLPESRTGNILHRPTLRSYEIPYLANSSVKKENQILPEDIMVSLRRDRIILRSERLNKEIIPRLTTAHNFSNNALPIYHFLCSMQTQGLKSHVGFNWGPLSNQYPFLPRVCYKNLVFSLAKWNIQMPDFEKFIKIKDETKLLDEIDKWRNALNMPNWVTLEDGDNELPIKLSNLLSVKTLLFTVKQRKSFVLKEFLAGEENMVVKNPEGSYTNEIILSFYRET
jgi:hypothetical protein